MPGDWIKVEIDTAHKPEVLKLARLLSIPKAHAFGLVVTFWGWCDKNTSDGNILGVTDEDIDIFLSQPGFAKAMQDVGWLKYDPSVPRIEVPAFDVHNSESAKKRSQKTRRQQRWRAHPAAQRGNGEYRFVAPDWLDAPQFARWIKIRPAKARTDDAQAAAVAKLEKFRAEGIDPNAVVAESLANGWQGLFKPDDKHRRATLAERNEAARQEAVRRMKERSENDPG